MQWFLAVLMSIWTIFFGLIFFLLFPDALNRVLPNKTGKHKVEQIQPNEEPMTQEEVNEANEANEVGKADVEMPPPTTRPCPTPSHQKKKEVQQEVDEKPIPMDKNSPPVHLTIKGKEPEIETYRSEDDLRKSLDKKMQSALENRLISILVKMNIAMCDSCTRDDKRIILQLKMMQAFLDGKPKLALKYSEELDQYVNKVKNKKEKAAKEAAIKRLRSKTSSPTQSEGIK
jgi:hypothetical protein